ncbi:MAG: NRDE family protein [Halofilum sp. (in: g-proteobacteria)]|nr:NRDE family protein [Halofilum sp. (in: g-proteobacteria)]
MTAASRPCSTPPAAGPGGAPSRGALVPAFLAAGEPGAAAAAIQADAARYAGFHFLGGVRGRAWYARRGARAATPLGPGLHGIDNAGLDVDDPRLERARRGFAAAAPDSDALLALLADDGDPGRGAGDDRPIFIRAPEFGTRCSTILRIAGDGALELVERRFCAAGEPHGETRLAWHAPAAAAGSG